MTPQPGDPEAGQIRGLGRALHGRPAVVVNVHDQRFGIGRQVTARLDGDLGQLFQAGFLALGTFGERVDVARDGRDLAEKVKFALVEFLGRAGEAGDDGFDETLQGVVEVVVFGVAFLVRELVGLHVPDELVGGQLRLLGQHLDELDDVAHVVVANGLDQLRHVKEDRVRRIRVEASDGQNQCPDLGVEPQTFGIPGRCSTN